MTRDKRQDTLTVKTEHTFEGHECLMALVVQI